MPAIPDSSNQIKTKNKGALGTSDNPHEKELDNEIEESKYRNVSKNIGAKNKKCAKIPQKEKEKITR